VKKKEMFVLKMTLPEETKIVQALAPAADAAGRTSNYFSMKNAGRCFVIVNIAQGNAATILLSILQATAVAGTGSKAITNVVPIWADLDTATSDALARAVDAVSYTTDAGVKNKVVVFQIDPRSLDGANGFDCIALSTGASNAANITSAMLIMTDLRYPQDIPPSVIID
jgi:hypothetical protein